MVFLPTRIKPHDDEASSDDLQLNHGPRVIIDLLDTVGNIRDGDHLQCVAFLAQEFGLMSGTEFLFGSIASNPPRPHSLLLEGHFYALLRDGFADLDGTGRLRLRRDLYHIPTSGLAARRLSALSELSPRETAVFAAAVLRLANEGKYAGSARHDSSFRDAVFSVAALDGEGRAVDVAAICDARQSLMPAEPVMLSIT
jgi:hypothetical protein